jgi:uncharacterized protein YbjT (DUF2867 family)
MSTAMSDRHLQRALVIGASGMLGTPVTAALIANGFTVSALARKANSTVAGAREIVGDVFDRGSLDAAMRETDVVYINLGAAPTDRERDKLTEREGIATIIAAAKDAKVRRLAMISPMAKAYEGVDGYHFWGMAVKQAAERAVIESGLEYTVFRASSFFENLRGGMRRGDAISVMGRKWNPQRFVSGKDFGALVARALASPASANRVLYAQGREALSSRALAERYIAARTGEKLELQAAPLGVMKFVGFFSRPLGNVVRLMEALDAYDEPFAAQETWDEFGAPSESVEAYAARP